MSFLSIFSLFNVLNTFKLFYTKVTSISVLFLLIGSIKYGLFLLTISFLLIGCQIKETADDVPNTGILGCISSDIGRDKSKTGKQPENFADQSVHNSHFFSDHEFVPSYLIDDAYKNDEDLANKVYKGKSIKVIGKIKDIELVGKHVYVVSLSGSVPFINMMTPRKVEATLNKSEEKKILYYNIGDSIALSCIGNGTVGISNSPALKNCQIIPSHSLIK